MKKANLFFSFLMIMILLSSTLSLMIEPVEAKKAQGKFNTKYGHATSHIVCGDRLCSEVEESILIESRGPSSQQSKFAVGGAVQQFIPVSAPPLIITPENIFINTSNSSGEKVEFSVIAYDNFEREIPVECNYSSGMTFSVGKTIVTCSATDSSDITSERTFTIQISLGSDSETPEENDAETVEENYGLR